MSGEAYAQIMSDNEGMVHEQLTVLIITLIHVSFLTFSTVATYSNESAPFTKYLYTLRFKKEKKSLRELLIACMQNELKEKMVANWEICDKGVFLFKRRLK